MKGLNVARDEKIRLIRQYAKHLRELAEAYSCAATIADRLPENILDGMVTTSIEGNRVHQAIGDMIDASIELN